MILLFKAALILAPGIFLVPRKWKGYVALIPIVLLVVSTTPWSLEVLGRNHVLQIRFFQSSWSGDLVLAIAKISAFFILIINILLSLVVIGELYTSTSYTESVRELIGRLVDIKGNHVSFSEKEIFPLPRTYTTIVKDLIEERVVVKPVHYVTTELRKAGWAQSGMINHYPVYPLAFLIVISLLNLIGLI